jgi:hypothetical protein
MRYVTDEIRALVQAQELVYSTSSYLFAMTKSGATGALAVAHAATDDDLLPPSERRLMARARASTGEVPFRRRQQAGASGDASGEQAHGQLRRSKTRGVETRLGHDTWCVRCCECVRVCGV